MSDPFTQRRIEEIREVAKMGDWDGDPRAVALVGCLRDLLKAFDRLEGERAQAIGALSATSHDLEVEMKRANRLEAELAEATGQTSRD